jgi:gluconate 5-dehydrogenase
MSASAISQLFDLHGRTALVTGGNSGIGEAMAFALGAAGATLILMARRADALESSAQRLRAKGMQVQTLSCDLADLLPQLAQSKRWPYRQLISW